MSYRCAVIGFIAVGLFRAEIAARPACGTFVSDNSATTSAPEVPRVVLESVVGKAGTEVVFTATLRTAGRQVAATQNDIAFDRATLGFATTPGGKPYCLVNLEIDKQASSFEFQPHGCTGAACTAVRATVLSNSNVDPIPDRALLYSCRVEISPGAQPGDYPLTIGGIILRDPNGDPLADATGTDGVVLVRTDVPMPTPVIPFVVAVPVSGSPGQEVTVPVVLQANGFAIAQTQNDLTFDAGNTPIEATANTKPACTVNPEIDKNGTAFAFFPQGCSGAACTMVRAVLVSLESFSTPIPDGAQLYSCTIKISSTATSSFYSLHVSHVTLTDPNGVPLPSVGSINGGVFVVEPSPTASASPPPTPTASPTPTAAAQSSGGSCQLDPSGGHWAVFAIVGAFLVALLSGTVGKRAPLTSPHRGWYRRSHSSLRF